MLVEASIIVGAVLAGAAAIQHFYDRYHPKGLYTRTLRTSREGLEALRSELGALRASFAGEEGSEGQDPLQEALGRLESLPEAITHALKEALPAMPDLSSLPAAIQGAVANGIVEASTQVMKAQLDGFTPEQTQGVQSMGVDAATQKALTKSLKGAIGADMLGPYGGILQEWAPTVYAWLSEHPDSVQWALEQPFVQGIIKKAASLVASRGHASMENNEWGR